MLSLFSRVRLCDFMNCSQPGSSVHGILQVRLLERVAMPSSRESSRPRDLTCVSHGYCITGNSLPMSPQLERASQVELVIKNLHIKDTGIRDYPLQQEMATHSSIFAWEIPRTEDPDGLQSMGLQSIRYNERLSTCVWVCKCTQTHTHTHTSLKSK